MASAVHLVLASAPAGSGKSTLLASWVAGRAEAVAWLQAEESDSDPVSFWKYLIRAIAESYPIAADELTALVASSKGDELVVVSTLVNELAAVEQRLIVVIDDFHLIADASVQRGVERFIDLCPGQVSLVLSTRFDPPFRLGRLRVRGQMAEIRAEDLRFQVGDAAALLGPTAGLLEISQLETLCGRTEGWAAGLVLAGISLKRATDVDAFVEAFHGDDHLVVEYLRDEYLAGLGPLERTRLLETSILEQLRGDLVDAVTSTEPSTGMDDARVTSVGDGASWLRQMAKENQLVIALDHTGTWFRYHHLLRDLLLLEASRDFPTRLSTLHERAARWFESQGRHGPAITHWLAAGDPHAAARLLFVHGPHLLAEGEIDTLRGLLVQLGDVARTVTWCALLMGWCEFIGGRASGAADWLDAMTEAAPIGFDHTVAAPLRINISLASGDLTSALVAGRTMDSMETLTSRPCELATAVGAAYAWAGLSDDARRVLSLAVTKASNDGMRTAGLLALVYRAVVELDSGTTASAHAAASRAVETAQGFGLGEYHGLASAYAIRGRTSRNAEDARVDAQHAVTLARRASTDLALGYVLCLSGDTLLDVGGDDSGRVLLEEARTVVDRCVDPGIVGRHLAHAESRHQLSPLPRRDSALIEQLTDRELCVLRYLPGPMSQREIAADMYVSLNTIKTHCRAIFRKLDATDRKAAVQAARDHDLL
ncbi:MAG: LuxR C-terminal-related transcriptional regulator [Microthrixaceae bacterium]